MEFFGSDSMFDPINLIYIAIDFFCFAVLLTILFAVILSVATGVGDCWWTISAISILVEVDFCQFSNNPPNSTSVADDIKFLMMLISTCTGPFSGGISFIIVLDFVILQL